MHRIDLHQPIAGPTRMHVQVHVRDLLPARPAIGLPEVESLRRPRFPYRDRHPVGDAQQMRGGVFVQPVERGHMHPRHDQYVAGNRLAEIHERDPERLRAWREAPDSVLMPGGGESLQQVFDRAWPALLRAASGLGDDAILLLVAHDAVNRVLLCHVLGIPFARLWTFMVSFPLRWIFRSSATVALDTQRAFAVDVGLVALRLQNMLRNLAVGRAQA